MHSIREMGGVQDLTLAFDFFAHFLKDFRAPFRVLAGVQDGFNRKGLIDPVGRRKLAFDVVREWNRSRR